MALVTSLLFKDHRGLSEEIYYVIDTQMTLDPMTWDFYGPSTSHIDFQPKQKFLKAIREMIVVFNVRDSFFLARTVMSHFAIVTGDPPPPRKPCSS